MRSSTIRKFHQFGLRLGRSIYIYIGATKTKYLRISYLYYKTLYIYICILYYVLYIMCVHLLLHTSPLAVQSPTLYYIYRHDVLQVCFLRDINNKSIAAVLYVRYGFFSPLHNTLSLLRLQNDRSKCFIMTADVHTSHYYYRHYQRGVLFEIANNM